MVDNKMNVASNVDPVIDYKDVEMHNFQMQCIYFCPFRLPPKKRHQLKFE